MSEEAVGRLELELEANPDFDVGEPAPGDVLLTDVEDFTMSLECAGRLEEAGGAAAVAALVEDRPSLRQALAAARAAVAAIGPVADEPMVLFAQAMLGSPSTAGRYLLGSRRIRPS